MTVAALEISNVLTYLINKARISEAELARMINVPRATINRLASGKTPDPRASTLNAIAEYFNISVDQLLGQQPLFLDNNGSLIANAHTSIPILEWSNILDWKKLINHLKPDNHFDWIMVDPSIDQGKFAVRVNGESMWPQFQENTILIISPSKEVKNRDFVMAHIKKHNGVVFRQLIFEHTYQFLKPINDMFPTIELEKSDTVIGVVIQTRKNYI